MRLRLCTYLLTACLLIGCPTHQPTTLDNALPANVSHIQAELNTLLLTVKDKAGKRAGSYQHFSAAYRQINSELAVVASQLAASQHEQTLRKQIDILQKSIHAVERIHKAGFKSAADVEIARQTLNDDFTAIYRYQYHKINSQGGA